MFGDIEIYWNIPRDKALTRVSIYAKQWVPHPDYFSNDTGVFNNIGLVQLPTPVFYNLNVYPAAPNFIKPNGDLFNLLYVGKEFSISGWGRDQYIIKSIGAFDRKYILIYFRNSDFPSRLQYTYVKLISLSECRQTWGFVDENTICAISTTSSPPSNVCSGDSGKRVVYSTIPPK